MMAKTTIIYYTHNREYPLFERKIQENILNKCGGLPIVSVSHKPIDFGVNICVGEQQLSYSNVLRQTLIGLKEAKTEFCLAAEDDCLYPPEYFQFTPATKDNVYRYTNIFVHFDRRDRFWRKRFVEAAQICGRELWIKSIEKILEGHDSWEPIRVNPPYVFTSKDEYSWTGKNPVIYFKTRNSFKFKTGIMPGGSVTEIPYWGNAKEIYNKYLKKGGSY
jgi:hypothetical protein